MTRFARAKGSKASNEKKPGEATSWADMKKGMLLKNTSKPTEENSSKNEDTNTFKSSNTQKQTQWAALKTPQSLLQPSYLKRKNETGNNVGSGKKNKIMKKEKFKLSNKNETQKESAQVNVTKETFNKNLKNVSEKKVEDVKEDLSKVGKKSKNKKKKLLAEKSLNKVNNSEVKENSSKDSGSVVNQLNNVKDNSSNLNKSDNSVVSKKNKKRKLKKGKQEGEVVKKAKKMSDVEEGEKKSEDWQSDLNKNSNEEQGKERIGVNKNNKGKGVNKNLNNEKNVKQNSTIVTEETIANGEKVKIVKFQGFPLRQDDAERLEQLKDDMVKKGIPQEKVDAVLKLERRKAEKSLKRSRKNVCFHCRGPGHFLSNCPELTENQNTGTGICYKCGSTEHCATDCKVVKGSNFRFAECFICKEQGHIARQCPDNPRGLYPMGGACKVCGDVTHLKKDCPKVMEKKSEEILTVGVREDDRALECLDEEIAKKEKESVRPKKKVSNVKF